MGRGKVREHLSHFIKEGSSVLEISYDTVSVLPTSIAPENACFLALSENSLAGIQPRHVLNLSGKDSPILPWNDNQFDAVSLSRNENASHDL